MRRGCLWLGVALMGGAIAAGPALAHEGHDADELSSGATAQPPHVFDPLKMLAGEWAAAEDTPSFKRGELISRYALTGGGTALVDTLFPGKPYEMATVYHRDGADLALSHDCSSGNQPHLRARIRTCTARAFD